MSNFHIVSFERHRNQKWNWPPNHSFAAGTAVVPLYCGELAQAVAAMPVAFVEETGKYRLVAVTSLLPEANCFVGADAQWRGRYIPAFFRLYPFRVLPSATGDPLLCIDEDSGALVPDNQPGLPFFSPGKTPSRVLQEIIEQFRKLALVESHAQAAIMSLADAGVIQPWPLKLTNDIGGAQDIRGLHRVDEEKLDRLDHRSFVTMRQPWALTIAYGQIYSANQLDLITERSRNRVLSFMGGQKTDTSTSARSGVQSTPPLPQNNQASKQSKNVQRKIVSLLGLAKRLTRANRLGKAESVCLQIVELDRGHAESWGLLGAIALQRGRIDDAAVMSSKAVNLNPNLSDAFYNLGIALKTKGEINEAISSYERALALKPEYVDALVNLGSALYDIGRTQDAVLRYEQALSFRPKSPTILYNLGNSLDVLGRGDESMDRYQQALAIKPDYVEALSNLGGVLARQGNVDAAIIYYERAIATRPDPQILNNLTLAYLDKNCVNTAVEHCLASIRQSGILVLGLINLPLSLKNILDDLPSDYAFTLHQEQYLASLMLCCFSKQSVTDWSAMIAPLRRFSWSREMCYHILVNQAISHWVQGNLGNHISIVTHADQLLSKLKDFTSPTFLANRAYHNYLRVLQQQIPSCDALSSAPIVTIVGDSHGLSFNRLNIEVEGRPYQTKAELVMGAKAWHLASECSNRYKHRFEWAITCAAEYSVIFCSFGEIDCRLTEGILPFYRKRGGNIGDLIHRQTAAYVSYVSERLRVRKQTPVFLGVPAPFLESPHYQLDGATLDDQSLLIEIIRLFNEGLRQATLRGRYTFVDLYVLTNDLGGKASGRFHSDSYHLKAEALVMALRNL